MTDLLTADGARIARLEDRVRELERELAEKDQQIDGSRYLVEQGMRSLRKQLSPLYTALQQVFGELDALGTDAPPDVAQFTQMGAVDNGYWATWKSRLPKSAARIVDCLLATPHLGSSALANALKMDPRTVRDALASMRKVGILATDAAGKHALRVPGGE